MHIKSYHIYILICLSELIDKLLDCMKQYLHFTLHLCPQDRLALKLIVGIMNRYNQLAFFFFFFNL